MAPFSPVPADRRYGPLAPFVPLARSLVSSQTFDQEDLLQEALFALHLALLRTPKPDKPFAFARTVMSRAILNHATKPSTRRFESSEDLLSQASLIDVTRYPLCEEDNFLDRLEKTHGKQAREIATVLLQRVPVQVTNKRSSPRRSMTRRAVADRRAKQRETDRRDIERRGADRRGYSIKRVQQESGMSEWRFQKVLDQIRTFTREWCIKHDAWYLSK